MHPRSLITAPLIGAALAFGGMAQAQSQSQSQTTGSAEEIVITGKYGMSADEIQSLSQSVSYADLDLSTAEGKKVLRQRVNLTARWLCQKLGKSDTASPPVPSCRQAAVSDAMARVGTLESGAAPRGTTWTAPTAWSAPYPGDWSTKYP